MQEVFFNFPFEGKGGRRLDRSWYHIFGPTNVREQFPEEELTSGKNGLLDVESLAE